MSEGLGSPRQLNKNENNSEVTLEKHIMLLKKNNKLGER